MRLMDVQIKGTFKENDSSYCNKVVTDILAKLSFSVVKI